MRKLFILIAVLALFTGTAFAGNLNDLMTAEYAADTKGRSVVSDSSVVLNIWNITGSLSPKIGVSGNTGIVFYESGQVLTTNRIAGSTYVDTSNSSYDTIGEVVDAINADTTKIWKASVGRDAYRAMSSAALLGKDVVAVGQTEDTTGTVELEIGEADFMTCGVGAKSNAVNRIKSIQHKVAGTGNVIVRIYDGDTLIYREDTSAGHYDDAGAAGLVGASPNTVNFGAITDGKGIAGSRGNGLVLRVDRTAISFTDTEAETAEAQLQITYDQIVK